MGAPAQDRRPHSATRRVANATRQRLLASRHAGQIDLLVTDVIMPDMNGRVLSQRLTQLRPTIKTLYLSGYTDDAILHHGVLEEGVAFLQKPFSLGALARKVREVIEARP